MDIIYRQEEKIMEVSNFGTSKRLIAEIRELPWEIPSGAESRDTSVSPAIRPSRTQTITGFGPARNAS
jgi:hypothetical protein